MKSAFKNPPVTTIDEYLAALPKPTRDTLQKLRQTIRSVAPKAEEVISYQIPSFKDSYMLVGFAAFKDHCGFYLMSTAAMRKFQEELKGYDTATATIRFPADKPLPAALVKRIVKERMAENEERRLKKAKK